MSSKTKAEGVTPSERYLSKLCRRSFLSLWSYTNLYTDRGRKGGKGAGKELCDLLVVFGDDVIIFSDKHVEFDCNIHISDAWRRWFKRAIIKSANQLYGAEKRLLKYQDSIYLDRNCQELFPVSLPSTDRMRIHRVAVARGIEGACRDYFGGNGLGSLMINSDLVGDSHFSMPFNIGHVNQEKGFVHVFEDFTLDAVFKELDTVADFVAYLSKRAQFLSREKPIIRAPGDEQLLSIYLTKINASGEHDFILPGEGIPDDVAFDESFWESMVNNPQYIAKKKADEISYVWDRLIEHFIEFGRGYKGQSLNELEQSLRHMASEPRLRRRQLAEDLVGFLKNTPNGMRAARLVYSKAVPERAYLFLVFPFPEGREYDEYREVRKNLLSAYCKVARLKCPEVSYIVGFATDIGTEGASEDLMVLDVREWTPKKQEEAERLQKDHGLLLDAKIKETVGRTLEWPDVKNDLADKPHSSGLNRKQYRRLEKNRRRKKKK